MDLEEAAGHLKAAKESLEKATKNALTDRKLIACGVLGAIEAQVAYLEEVVTEIAEDTLPDDAEIVDAASDGE